MNLLSFRLPSGKDIRITLKKPAILWAVPFLLVFICVVSYWIALDKVTVQADGRTITKQTLAGTVGEALKDVSVDLSEGDEVTPGLKSHITEGMSIRITRAIPIHIKADGQERLLHTVPVNVGEALRRAGIRLGAEDRVSVPVTALITPEQNIKVIRVTSRIVSDIIRVNPTVEYVKDKNMDEGDRKTLQNGQPGRIKRTVKVVSEDGRITQYMVIAKELLEKPLNQIIAVGIRPIIYTMTTSRGRVVRYTKVWTMRSTAYYPGPESCGKGAKGYTFSGKKAGYGIVAVDRRQIPMGTMLYIEGYGFAEAADTGSAIKGDRIDLCFDTYREASMYGVKNIKVYFVAP